MTDQEAKAEAQKIVQEFKPFVESEPFYSNKGGSIRKSIEYNAQQCAIIKVKGIIEEIEECDNKTEASISNMKVFNERVQHWQSILKAIEEL